MDFRNSIPSRNVGISITVCCVLISIPLFFRVSRRVPQESLSLQPQTESGQTQTEDVHILLVSPENKTEHKEEEEVVVFGIPKQGMDYVIIYNAVPKCGSRSLLHSLGRLKKHRDTKVDIAKNVHNVSALKDYVVTMETPGFVSGHLPFQYYNRTDVIYINMIRNPLDRLVSLYYFDLYGDKGGKHNDRFLNSTRKLHIDSLEILAKQKGFVNRKSFLHFFAGNSANPGESVEAMVARAKNNIRRHFIFIGISEEYQTSIQILEKLLPDYMRGLLKAYQETMAEHREKFDTINKAEPSAHTKVLLMENDLYLKHELEIYRFVKQQFDQLKQIHL